MASKSSRRVATATAALALVAFPAGAAARTDYSQNSVNGDTSAPLLDKTMKDYSMNAATGDYVPPIDRPLPVTRVVRVHDDPGFAWDDASAGAGVAFGLALLGMTTARKVRRRRVSPPSPAQPRTV
jgi:hypothetical protein